MEIMSTVLRRETVRTVMARRKRQYLKSTINELGTDSKNKNNRGLYNGVN
jgi:hypothetical protein